MIVTCENCRYYDVDYEWDDDYEEEIEVDTCRKGHEIDFALKNICPDFQESKPMKYIEKDTECDKCELLSDCKENGCVFNVSTSMDSREHFIPGLRFSCRKIMGGKSK